MTCAKPQDNAPDAVHSSATRIQPKYSATTATPAIPAQVPSQVSTTHSGSEIAGIRPSCW